MKNAPTIASCSLTAFLLHFSSAEIFQTKENSELLQFLKLTDPSETKLMNGKNCWEINDTNKENDDEIDYADKLINIKQLWHWYLVKYYLTNIVCHHKYKLFVVGWFYQVSLDGKIARIMILHCTWWWTIVSL